VNNYSIFAAMFADQLEPGQKVKLRFHDQPVTIAGVQRLRSGRVIIRHDRGACVRGAKELVRLEVER
jgi:hypothetical protein